VSGPPRSKPGSLSAQHLAGEALSTVRDIGRMLADGKRPPRPLLALVLRQLGQQPTAKPWRELIVASIACADIELLAAELRQRGEGGVEKARDMLAADYGHASGPALARWLRRTLAEQN
jgi:hypothetical protein